jgi:hypothetical protein
VSIRVEVADLMVTTGEYGWAYLLTVCDDQRAHVVAVSPTWSGGELEMSVGGGTGANAAARPIVSLCYPPLDRDGYSLIVDGEATVADGVLRLAPTTAVLHRPAPEGFDSSASGCASDCLPVTPD